MMAWHPLNSEPQEAFLDMCSVSLAHGGEICDLLILFSTKG